jgi:hypothetical protein
VDEHVAAGDIHVSDDIDHFIRDLDAVRSEPLRKRRR